MNTGQEAGAGARGEEQRVKRRMRSKQERRRVVEEILVPGASVAMVARAHGVNTNQIYHWRKLYERGLLGPAKRMSKLVPVTITEAADAQPVTDEKDEQGRRDRCCSRTERGTIHVTLKDVHMCVEGRVDESSLRIVLERLLQ